MRRRNERGEGQVGVIIALALVVAVGLAAWNVIPVYYDHYDFTDAMEEICRTPKHKARNDKAIKDMRKVLNDYPDTYAAKEAGTYLEQLEIMKRR